jgi:hypothetical protein
MHTDLIEVIATAKEMRNRLMNKEVAVKEANGVAAQNHAILQAHAIDLRTRMFLAESQQQIARHEQAMITDHQGNDQPSSHVQ